MYVRGQKSWTEVYPEIGKYIELVRTFLAADSGFLGKAKIKFTWNLNTERGASELENFRFQFHF